MIFKRAIQVSCEAAILLLGLVLTGSGCGSSVSASVGPIQFSDSNVAFSNSQCSVGFTLVNIDNRDYTLIILSGTFEDPDGQTKTIELDQTQIRDVVGTLNVPPLTSTDGQVTFDLQGAGLVPPLQGTLVVAGVNGSAVTHFVGTFSCE